MFSYSFLERLKNGFSQQVCINWPFLLWWQRSKSVFEIHSEHSLDGILLSRVLFHQMASCRINYSSNLTGHVHHRADHWRPWRYWSTRLQALRGVFLGTHFLSCFDVFPCLLQFFWCVRSINGDFLLSFYNWSWTVTKNWFCWWKTRAGRGFCDRRGGIPKSTVNAFSRIWFLNTAGHWNQDVLIPGNISFHFRGLYKDDLSQFWC